MFISATMYEYKDKKDKMLITCQMLIGELVKLIDINSEESIVPETN